MMATQQYRQKAQEALEAANSVEDAATKAAWEAIAQHWVWLAAAAESQDLLLLMASGLATEAAYDDDGSGPLQ